MALSSGDLKLFNTDVLSGHEHASEFSVGQEVVVLLAKGYFPGRIERVTQRRAGGGSLTVLLDSLDPSLEQRVVAPPTSVVSLDKFSQNFEDDDVC